MSLVAVTVGGIGDDEGACGGGEVGDFSEGGDLGEVCEGGDLGEGDFGRVGEFIGGSE